MNERLQKKCLIASAGLHLTLLAVFFFGSGFLSSGKVDTLPLLEFVPMITTDANVSGGGNPNAKPPPPAPAPAPQPQRQAVPPPEPPKPAPKLDKSDPNSLETKQEKKAKKSDIVLKRWTDTPPKQVKPNTNSNFQNDAQARADAQRRQLAGSAARSLKQNLSTGTSIEMPGPGGGGPTYANWMQAVRTIYATAWAGTVPDGATDVNTFVVVSVTIARDGSVVTARVVQSSGKPQVDASVQSLLRRVRQTVPIPQDSSDKERTVEIKFRVDMATAQG